MHTHTSYSLWADNHSHHYHINTSKTEQGNFLKFFMVLYSTLLHLPPLRFQCVGECWDRTQDSCDFGIDCQMLYSHPAKSHPKSATSHPHLATSHPQSATSHPHSATSYPPQKTCHPPPLPASTYLTHIEKKDYERGKGVLTEREFV
jgi:hypothetical protein